MVWVKTDPSRLDVSFLAIPSAVQIITAFAYTLGNPFLLCFVFDYGLKS